MRNLLLGFVVVLLLAADDCFAQTNAVTVMCTECRDPVDYPDDYVNFAFNQIYGPDSWMPFELADDFFITNSDGQTVYVDVDFIFLGFGVEGLRLPFWPTNMLRITLALPDGSLHQAIRSIFQTSLPVPSSGEDDQPVDSGRNPSDNDGGEDGEDEEDEYDADPGEREDPEIDDPVGIVEIEDPDENGNFAGTEWCEEC